MSEKQNTKPTKEEADKKVDAIQPESAAGSSTEQAQFDPKTGRPASGGEGELAQYLKGDDQSSKK